MNKICKSQLPGSIGSPQILLLSGIGPKAHLNQIGIPVVLDLPVGNNLQNHVAITTQWLINNESLNQPQPELTTGQLYELFAYKSGPLSKFSIITTYFNTKNNTDKQWPNVNMEQLASGVFTDLDTIVAQFDSSKINEWKDYFRPFLNKSYIYTAPQLMRPKSTGTIRLASTDPFVYPLIDPQYLSVPSDFDDVFEATKFNFIVFMNSSIANYLTLIPKPIPGCQFCPNIPVYECDSYIKCLITQLGSTGYHPVGTCRMGNVNRSDVVVDERLRVKHVTGLRVIDDSIMPMITNGNTGTVAFMIGEYGADLIKQDHLQI